MLEYRYASVSSKGGWLEELLRRLLPPSSVTEAAANKVGAKLPNWMPLQYAVALPFFILMVPDLRAKKRKRQAMERLVEEDDKLLAEIANTSQNPQVIFAAGMQRILNHLQLYNATRRS